MQKAQLTKEIARKTGLSLRQSKEVLNILIDSIKQTLKKGEKVTLIGFGTLGVRKRAARKGRNPQTGKEIKIPAARVVYFRAGKKLKNAVKR